LKNNLPDLISVLERAPEGVAIWDSEDRLVMCNEKFRELHNHIDHKIEPGLKNQHMIQWINEAGIIRLEEGEFAEWKRDDLGNPIRDYSKDVVVHYNNRWVQIRRNKLDDGSIIAFHTDITNVKKSEDRFRKIFESGPAMVSISTIDSSTILDVNEVWLKTLGYEKHEVIGKSPFDIDMLVDTDIRSKISRTVRNEGIQNVATQYRTKSRKIRDFLVSGEHIEFAGQDCILFISQEITDRIEQEMKIVEAQEVTKRSLDTLHLAINAMSSGFALWDSEDRLIICNHKYREMYPSMQNQIMAGVKFEDMVRTSINNGEIPEAIGNEEKWLEKRMEAHRNANTSIEYQMSSGQWILALERPTLDGGSIGERIDITDQKNSQLELKNARDRLEERVQERTLESDILRQRLVDAVDSFTGGFVLFDKDDRLVICNDDYLVAMNDVADILKPGVTFEEFLRVRAERGNRKDGLKRDEEWIQKRLEQHRNPQGPIERTYDDGKTFQLHEFKTREGGTVILRTDVSALKKSERELNDAVLTAEAANRAKSDFLANMSHELRTPLNAIIGFSDVLSEKVFGEFTNEKQEEYIANIHESGQHLLNLISDILDVSAIEADRFELNETEVDIADAVRASLLLVKSRAEINNVRLINEINGNLPAISADERRMKQILVNLLSNAVKFTPTGGTVTVSSDSNDRGTKSIFITDTGIGMSEEEIALAMEPFVQVGHELNSTNEGTGLGLPLTKRLVEALGGELIIESEQKVGTKVNLEFPIEKFVTLK